MDACIYDRHKLQSGDRISGPAILVEYSATTLLPPGCVLTVDAYGNLVIEVGE